MVPDRAVLAIADHCELVCNLSNGATSSKIERPLTGFQDHANILTLSQKNDKELKTARGHLLTPQKHLYNGLARSAV